MSTYFCNVKKDLKFQDLICFFLELFSFLTRPVTYRYRC